jgi:hypothetical protein
MTMRRFRRMRRQPAPTTDTRPPAERLEALVREQNGERRERILMRIRGDIVGPSEFVPWVRAARELADRLITSDDTFYYLAGLFLDSAFDGVVYVDEELVRLSQAIEDIERAHGLRDDESFVIEDAPEEWTALNRQWDARMDTIHVDMLRAAGQADVAELHQRDRDEFERRAESGYSDFWGEDVE